MRMIGNAIPGPCGHIWNDIVKGPNCNADTVTFVTSCLLRYEITKCNLLQ